MKRGYVVLGCVVALCANAALAESANLQATQEKIRAVEAQRAEARKELAKAKKASAKLQRDIVDKAAHINSIERDVLQQQRDIARLKAEEAKQQQLLEQRKTHMGRLVSAAWSLQHRPQLAAWMIPEKTRERALTARGLHMTTIALRQDMDALNLALREQEKLRDNIIVRRQENESRSQSLKHERAVLEASLAERQALVNSIQSQQMRHVKKIASLTDNAKNMQQLITNLEVARKEAIDKQYRGILPMNKPIWTAYDTRDASDEPDIPDAPPRPKRSPGESFKAAKGTLPLPANGMVIGQYGDKRGINDRLKGMEIRTLPAATVTAPFEGEVLFTGDFLDYGKMVIVRHSHDYHTLVAGLSRIDVTRGQFLLDGEPIGAMGNQNNSRKLYMELRNASKTINPKSWFALTQQHYAKH